MIARVRAGVGSLGVLQTGRPVRAARRSRYGHRRDAILRDQVAQILLRARARVVAGPLAVAGIAVRERPPIDDVDLSEIRPRNALGPHRQDGVLQDDDWQLE